ncbi:MAG: DUF362 domain-containing protein [Candidatus Bathyarchaeota archaeon]|nr:DUF362 domain-containing protein [Candidatus Bathyarchaeota archaeon]
MPQRTVNIFRAADDISGILKQAMKDSGLRGKERIFVKPNLSHPEYVAGVVTDPALTFELVGLLRDGAEEVIVGESDGFNYPCRLAFEKTGMAAAVKRAGGTVVNLSEDKIVKVTFRGGSAVKQLFLPKTLLDADSVVDLPLMKTHEFMLYSGAIKNLFGCVPSNRRIYLHPYLPEVFYRLYTLLKPQLTVMDARVGIEGNGPTKGKPVKMDLILTSNCALATDVVSTKIMRLNWKETYLHYIAKRTGFSEDAVSVQGLRVADVARKFESPRIDLPVKAQMEIYKHEFLTKLFFCSFGVVKLFQKVTSAYRGSALQTA